MKDDLIYYRRNLPHIHPQDGTFCITFLLANALPLQKMQCIQNEKINRIKKIKEKYKNDELSEKLYQIEKIYFGKIDSFLASKSRGPFWLAENRLSQIVADKLHELDNNRYQLIAYTIMSNHVHVLFNTTGVYHSSNTNNYGKTKNYPVADTMR